RVRIGFRGNRYQHTGWPNDFHGPRRGGRIGAKPNQRAGRDGRSKRSEKRQAVGQASDSGTEQQRTRTGEKGQSCWEALLTCAGEKVQRIGLGNATGSRRG